MNSQSGTTPVGNGRGGGAERGCVVVGLESGPQPARTLTVAADEAARRHVGLAVVTVLRQRIAPGLSLTAAVQGQQLAEAAVLQELHRSAASLRLSFPELPVTTYCLGLVEVAPDREPLSTAEIIVIGTQADHGRRTMVQDSVGHVLLKASRCPVLIIADTAAQPPTINRGGEPVIVVGVGDHPADAAVVRAAYAESAGRGGEVLLVHAYSLALGETPEQGRDRTRNFLDEFVARAPAGVAVSALVTEDEPIVALRRLAARASLLVIGGRTDPLHGPDQESISQTLIEMLPCPVLAVPRQLTARPAGPLTGPALAAAQR